MLFIFVCLLLKVASVSGIFEKPTSSLNNVCEQIRHAITGEVFYAWSRSANFHNDIEHYIKSSTQIPTCVVEVASDEDVSHAMKIIAKTRTPFAVKSGGHASNPGFSSTHGVFISLARLTHVTVSPDKSTVELGTGSRWSDVYSALDGTKVNVVGGRVEGPGVGGLALGGGYSWLTSQWGLTCDTIRALTLILPDGTITRVDSMNPDLFFALKGGLNRFGIVTSIAFKAVPQTNMVYGGLQVYKSDKVPDLITAIDTFSRENKDPKAQVMLTINGGPDPSAILLAFYDGPNRPSAFDPFNKLDASALFSDIKTRSFSSLVKATPTHLEAGFRGTFHSLMTTRLTTRFMAAIFNESIYYGALHGARFLTYDIEPFGDYGKYATDSAFPHANSPVPINLFFSWVSESEDKFWLSMVQQSVDHLTEVAKSEGIYDEDVSVYPNHAPSNFGGDQLYGRKNAARLRRIQAKYDPNKVMLLTGGFNI